MKKILTKLFAGIILLFLFTVQTGYAATAPNYWKKSGDSILLIDPDWTLGSVAQPISTIYADNIVVSGGSSTDGNLQVEGDIKTISISAPAAPVVALASPAQPGNVDNGDHRYKITYVTLIGETQASTSTGAVTVADKTVNGKIVLTLPTSAKLAVLQRKIYRQFNNTGDYKFVATVNNNTATTYTDNIANASLGANVAPTLNTTGALEVAGSLVSTGPSSFGNCGDLLGDSSLAYTFDFCDNRTDFSAATQWSLFAENYTLDPDVDLTGANQKFITAHDFETFVPTLNSKDIDSVTNFYYYINLMGSGDVGELIGAQNGTILSGTGSADDVYGYLIQTGHHGTAGNIVDDVSILVQTPAHGNGATMTSHKGIELQNQEFGTNSWAIYSDGGKNYFKGNVGIGTGKTVPTEALDINGNIKNSGGLAIGTLGVQGLSGGAFRQYAFGDTFTDFSGFDEAHLFSYLSEIDPSANLTNDYIYGETFDVYIPASNDKDVNFLQSATFAAEQSGSGDVGFLSAGSFTTTHNGSGLVDDQIGFFSSSESYNAGDITNNIGISVGTGTNHASSNITTNTSIDIAEPHHVGGLVNNYGLRIHDQEFSTSTPAANASWAIKTEGGKVEFGAPTGKNSLLYMSSDDVVLPFTGFLPANVYGRVTSFDSAQGGLKVEGYGVTDNPGLKLGAYIGDDGALVGPTMLFDVAQGDGGGGLQTITGNEAVLYSFRNNNQANLNVVYDQSTVNLDFVSQSFSHAVTDILPGSTYGRIGVNDGGDGGLNITGASDAQGVYAFVLHAIESDTTTSGGVMILRSSKKDGANGLADLADNEEVLNIINNNNDASPEVKVFGSGRVDMSKGGLNTKVSTANVSAPPTDAELDSAFGTPATVGAGFSAVVNDNGGGTLFYQVSSDGTNWFYTSMTKAL